MNIFSESTVSVSAYAQTGGSADVNRTLISPTVSVSSGLLTVDGSARGNVTQTGVTPEPARLPFGAGLLGLAWIKRGRGRGRRY